MSRKRVFILRIYIYPYGELIQEFILIIIVIFLTVVVLEDNNNNNNKT